MVNEHYVPQSYLRLFAPKGEGLISRYSLIDTHPRGGYMPAKERYSVRKAASEEEYANGWLEGEKTNRIEQATIESIRRLRSEGEAKPTDIAHISQFLALQNDRCPESKLHFDARQWLKLSVGDASEIVDFDLEQSWDSVLHENMKDGHESLQYMGWVLVENHTKVPFITSDQPVAQYFEVDHEDVYAPAYRFEHREIFCPLGPGHCLVLLDPSRFDVNKQFPETEIERYQLEDRREVHKMNLLQVVTAFQEIFGPVGWGDYLERLVSKLCAAFPHEKFIRGNRWELKKIERAQRIAAGHAWDIEEYQWYLSEGKSITRSRRLKGQAIWSFTHSLNFIDELRLAQPRENYWDEYIKKESK